MPRSDRILVAAGGGAVTLVLAAAGILMLPAEGQPDAAADTAMLLLASPSPSVPPSVAAEDASIVVDVEGAVAQPGIRELPAGSRVADAIVAAGGYATDADLDATAATINLAKALADGEQIVVPRVGDGVQPAPSSPDGRHCLSWPERYRRRRNRAAGRCRSRPGVGRRPAASGLPAKRYTAYWEPRPG